jgi:hypothetical protein
MMVSIARTMTLSQTRRIALFVVLTFLFWFELYSGLRATSDQLCISPYATFHLSERQSHADS